MIYIATVHWETDKWVDIQLRYLKENIKQPYRVFAFLSGEACKHKSRFDFSCCEPIPEHAIKLNLLSKFIGQVANSSDVIIFIDGDAFPIKPLDGFIDQTLKRYPLAAIRRTENVGDIQPHPSFCFTTVGFWSSIDGDWKEGYQWETSAGVLRTDVGGNLLKCLLDNKIDWLHIERTGQLAQHPVMFGIYGEMVYHHGAGFRVPLSLYDRTKSVSHVINTPFLVRPLDWLLNRVSLRNRFRLHRLLGIGSKIKRQNLIESDSIYQKIISNNTSIFS